MSFDEEALSPHGECRHEIHKLESQLQEQDAYIERLQCNHQSNSHLRQMDEGRDMASEAKQPMKLHFTPEQIRDAIARDPDEAEYEAGPSHPEAPQPRFFVDHGVIHDRATGKHVRTCDCMGPFDDGIEAACALLNSLASAAITKATA
jgi:hypothetical protein